MPRLPPAVVDRLVDHFGTLQKLLSAGIDDLQVVEGVGELRARSVREGLSRLAESSILGDRFALSSRRPQSRATGERLTALSPGPASRPSSCRPGPATA